MREIVGIVGTGLFCAVLSIGLYWFFFSRSQQEHKSTKMTKGKYKKKGSGNRNKSSNNQHTDNNTSKKNSKSDNSSQHVSNTKPENRNEVEIMKNNDSEIANPINLNKAKNELEKKSENFRPKSPNKQLTENNSLKEPLSVKSSQNKTENEHEISCDSKEQTDDWSTVRNNKDDKKKSKNTHQNDTANKKMDVKSVCKDSVESEVSRDINKSTIKIDKDEAKIKSNKNEIIERKKNMDEKRSEWSDITEKTEQTANFGKNKSTNQYSKPEENQNVRGNNNNRKQNKSDIKSTVSSDENKTKNIIDNTKDIYKRNSNKDATETDTWNNPHKKSGSRWDKKPKSSEQIQEDCWVFEEVSGNLFDAPNESALAHCVAEDFQMGAGIAVEFRQRFKRTGYLIDLGIKTGGVAVLEKDNRYIYYLVTKRISKGKPTITTVQNSLLAMAEHAKKHNVKYISMPTIGSGLDRLDWDDVKHCIKNAFSKMDIRICIYHYDKGGASKRPSQATVNHKRCILAKEGKDTGLLYLAPVDNVITPEMKSINEHYAFLQNYKPQNLGEVIQITSNNYEITYGLVCIDKGKVCYDVLEQCLWKLRKLIQKDRYEHVGIQECDYIDMNYLTTLLKFGLPDITVWVCWLNKIPYDFADYDSLRH